VQPLKRLRQMRRAYQLFAITGLVLLIGTGSFLGARSLTQEEPASAEDPVTARGPNWFVPLLEEEAARPRFEQTLHGIPIGPEVRIEPHPNCLRSGFEFGTLEQLAESDLDVGSPQLPRGAQLGTYEIGVCDGLVVYANLTYSYEPGGEAPYGGSITISRARGRGVRSDIPSERFVAGFDAGRPVISAGPLTGDGWGDALVAIPEDFGITVVSAFGFRTGTLMAVARTVARPGGEQ